MKKITSLIIACLCFSLCLGLMACTNDKSNANKTNNSASTPTTCSHSWINADCENPKTCSKCNETNGLPLGHTTTTGICTRCNHNFGTWELGEFVDEFKQPTGEKYIVTQVDGTFSNSATTNSKLAAAIQITSDDVAIMLWEYGYMPVKCSYKWDDYNITMLDASGKKYYLNGTMYNGSSRIFLDNSDEYTIINALKQSGSISFYIVLTDRITTTYLFTVETTNFKDVYSNL